MEGNSIQGITKFKKINKDKVDKVYKTKISFKKKKDKVR